jgi:MoxR-like ATPase
VLATQNPLEHEGTYALPEAQVDRFALKLIVDYPSKEEELAVLHRMARTAPPLNVRQVVTLDEIGRARSAVDQVTLDPKLAEYIVALVQSTRAPGSRIWSAASTTARVRARRFIWRSRRAPTLSSRAAPLLHPRTSSALRRR